MRTITIHPDDLSGEAKLELGTLLISISDLKQKEPWATCLLMEIHHETKTVVIGRPYAFVHSYGQYGTMLLSYEKITLSFDLFSKNYLIIIGVSGESKVHKLSV